MISHSVQRLVEAQSYDSKTGLPLRPAEHELVAEDDSGRLYKARSPGYFHIVSKVRGKYGNHEYYWAEVAKFNPSTLNGSIDRGYCNSKEAEKFIPLMRNVISKDQAVLAARKLANTSAENYSLFSTFWATAVKMYPEARQEFLRLYDTHPLKRAQPLLAHES
jgi:hypothetical protein